MQYKVVWAWSNDDLAELVNSEIADGWELHGGVSISVETPGGLDGCGNWTRPDIAFAQSMVKKSSEA